MRLISLMSEAYNYVTNTSNWPNCTLEECLEKMANNTRGVSDMKFGSGSMALTQFMDLAVCSAIVGGCAWRNGEKKLAITCLSLSALAIVLPIADRVAFCAGQSLSGSSTDPACRWQ